MTPPPMSPWRWPLYAAGSAMLAYGLWGQVEGADTKPLRVAVLVVVAALAHDLVLAPLVLLVGLVVRRLLPAAVRPSLQGGALVALCLVLIAVPGLGRFGARTDNPSVLPRDYTRGLIVALAVVAVVTALELLRRAVQAVRARASKFS